MLNFDACLVKNLACYFQGKPDDVIHKTHNLLASCDCERLYMAPGVQRIPIEENGVYGTMFLPPKHLVNISLSQS